MKLELWYPVPKPHWLTQGWGVNGEWYRKNGIDILGHNGWDFLALHGDPIRAAHDGEITYVGIDAKEGVGIVLRTLDEREYGESSARFKTIYWHLCNEKCHDGSHKPVVKQGDVVKVGTILGYANNTGLSTGDHLHFGLKPCKLNEIYWVWWNIEQNNGYLGAIDPTPYWNRFYAEDAQKVLSMYEKVVELLRKLYGNLKVGK